MTFALPVRYVPAPVAVKRATAAHNRQQVGPFAIYRAARARDWTATPAEIAAVTGLSAHEVRRVLRERGWKLTRPEPEPDDTPPLLMDEFH